MVFPQLRHLYRGRHAPDEWLDLETFLRDLWKATREASINFYWSSYTWNPDFEMARKREQYPAGENRTLAFWFADEGVWAANAIMVTLVTLGLVERGQTAGKNCRPCFRLTELGRAVFGAPEIEAAQRQGDARFLMVQPNLGVDPSPPGVQVPATDPPAVIYRINRIPKRHRRA